MRKDSQSFGQWFGLYLSDENKKQFYVPEGFAHGFLVTSDEAEFVYKCTDYYYHEFEAGIIWNDPCLGIIWPTNDLEIQLSIKDERLNSFKFYR